MPETGFLLDWYMPLEDCRSLDELNGRWNSLLERHHLCAGYEDARYQGAVMSFLARSRLPAKWKLGAFLLNVPGSDIDPRLAFGALGEALDSCWVAGTSTEVCMEGDMLDVELHSPWRLGYLQGRLTEIWHSLRVERGDLDRWSERFWARFWVLCCGCADLEGVQLAMHHGAGISPRDCSGIAAASAGATARSAPNWQAEGRTDVDFIEVIDVLLQAQTTLEIAAGAALGAAAAADNVEILKHLMARGADIRADDDGALVMAAAHGSIAAVAWLLEQGANAVDEYDALVAAVCSLSVDAVDLLLDAGADIHASNELALRSAFGAKPYHLFAGEGQDFLDLRAAMICRLVQRGAVITHPAVIAAADRVPDLTKRVTTLLTEDPKFQ